MTPSLQYRQAGFGHVPNFPQKITANEVHSMYYVKQTEIEQRLQFILVIIEAMENIQQVTENSEERSGLSLTTMLAQERALHLAIETVTDIGSMIIDGFLMRDAGSYEDMVEILRQEEVFPQSLAPTLLQLISLRKPLVQEYWLFDREKLHPLIFELPQVLQEYVQSVRSYLSRELGLG
jgi:uncharacterized protein YutE (UPF0331/DUF86 family)